MEHTRLDNGDTKRGCTGSDRRSARAEIALFALASLCLGVAVSRADTTTADGITWKYRVAGGVARITGAEPATGALSIPLSLDGITVGGIEGMAFAGCEGLTDVTIPDSVTDIGTSAFEGCTGLASAMIPYSVTNIGRSAFEGCSRLEALQVAKDNPAYASHDGVLCTKDGTSLLCCPGGKTAYAVPATVTNIGERAFFGCANLVLLTLPDGLSDIGDSAFEGCSRLSSIAIPAGVMCIGKTAFDGCSGLQGIHVAADNPCYSSQDGILFTKRGLALMRCPDIKTVYAVPETVTTIVSHAFFGCSNLTLLMIPRGVKGIGNSVFEGCSALRGIHVASGNRIFSSNDGVLFNAVGRQLLHCPGDTAVYAVPGNVTNIANRAFSECRKLASLSIPASVESIGDSALDGCLALEEIRVAENNPAYASHDGVLYTKDGTTLVHCPARKTAHAILGTVTNIGTMAFKGCSNLVSVAIPAGVESIGASAFENCSGLASLAIGNSVTNIGNMAFKGCSNLVSVAIPDSVENIGASAFANCNALTSLAIGTGVTNIGALAFNGCSNLVSVTVPEYACSTRFDTLFPAAFTRMARVVVADGTTKIQNYVFDGCSELTSVSIPDSVTSLGPLVFYGCPGVPSDTTSIPGLRIVEGWVVEITKRLPPHLDLAGIRGIAESVFAGCPDLESVAISDRMTRIGDGVFQYCRNLASVTIPDSVTSIGSSAFGYCPRLASVTMGNSVTNIGWSAFEGCSGLASVAMGNRVEDIGDYAFSGCRSLASLAIPRSVTNLGYRVFFECSGLTSLTIPGSVTGIGKDAFQKCSGLKTLHVPAAWKGTGMLANANVPAECTVLYSEP